MVCVKSVVVLLSYFIVAVSSTHLSVSCGELKDIDYLTTQILLVNGKPGSVSKATIQACEKSNGTWTNALPIFDAVVGTNGIAQPGLKEEGDGLTPAGSFNIGEFFGWTSTSDPVVQQFKWDYRYIVDAKDRSGAYLDKFVDDSASPYYNTWVVGTSTASSYEQMRISPYKYGLVINYNMFPTVPGKGSAIFMHIWSGPDGSTAGCVALEEKNLISVLQWLDKTMQPQIVIIPPPL